MSSETEYKTISTLTYYTDQLVDTACVVDHSVLLDVAGESRRGDRDYQAHYKTEHRKILIPLIGAVNNLYTELQQLTRDTKDEILLNYALFGKFNWNLERREKDKNGRYVGRAPLTFGIALRRNKIYAVVETLCRCLRSTHRYVEHGGDKRASWPYQRRLTDKFEAIVEDILGSRFKVTYTMMRDDQPVERTRWAEPLVEKMRAVVTAYREEHPIPGRKTSPKKAPTSTTCHVVGSSGRRSTARKLEQTNRTKQASPTAVSADE